MDCFGKLLRRDEGAATVEMALVAGVFLFFILALVDFGCIIAVKSLLLKGAQDGLNSAEKVVGSEYDVRSLTPASDRYIRFREARTSVVNKATQVPVGALLTPFGVPSANRLAGFRRQDALSGNTILTDSTVTSAAYLRPGERAEFADLPGEFITHPVSVTAGADWKETLKNAPIMVAMCADVDALILRLGPNRRICERALGYRTVTQDELPTTGAIPVTTLPPQCNPVPTCSAPYSADRFNCNCACDAALLNCPAGTHADTSSCSCQCDLTAASCAAPKELDSSTCACVCQDRSPCPDGSPRDPGTCLCSTGSGCPMLMSLPPIYACTDYPNIPLAPGWTPVPGIFFAQVQGVIVPGFTLNQTTGVLSGRTHLGPGRPWSFEIEVKDGRPCASNGTCPGGSCNGIRRRYDIDPLCPSVSVTPPTVPSLTVGQNYSTQFGASWPTPPYACNIDYSTMSGSVPGASHNGGTRNFWVTPTQGGSYPFTITHTFAGTCTATQNYCLEVSCNCDFAFGSLPGGRLGQLYSASVGNSPSGVPYTVSISGQLPPGVTFYAHAGILYGFPTTPGSYTFTATANASNNCSSCETSRTFTIGVS